MIKTSRQLKDLVHNRSKGNSTLAQIIIRNYIMERFLERVSLSDYKNSFIFKGGLMVSSIVGLDNRSTMDIDTTLKNIDLSIEDIERIINDIISIKMDDGLSFSIKKISEIMDEAEYPGVRAALEATLDNIKTPLKIDFSTGDVITPHEIVYEYPLMFENRTISILAYNIETIIAEKLQTVLARSTANTRLRDFYDLCILYDTVDMDYEKLKAAYSATCEKRKTEHISDRKEIILEQIQTDKALQNLWHNYQHKYSYAQEYSWHDVMSKIKILFSKV